MAGRATRKSPDWWTKNNPFESGIFQCVGILQNGTRCLRIAEDGVNCDKHGGEEVQEATRRRHAQTLLGQAQWALDEQRRLAMDPKTDPAVKAKILDSMIDRAGLSAAQTVRLINAEQADPIERLFRAIAEDPEGLEKPREAADQPIAQPTDSKALEAPVDAAQEAYDRHAESHVPGAEVVELLPSDFGPVGPHAMSPKAEPGSTPPLPPRTVDGGTSSARPPKHIREAIERMERQRRGWA